MFSNLLFLLHFAPFDPDIVFSISLSNILNLCSLRRARNQTSYLGLCDAIGTTVLHKASLRQSWMSGTGGFSLLSSSAFRVAWFICASSSKCSIPFEFFKYKLYEDTSARALISFTSDWCFSNPQFSAWSCQSCKFLLPSPTPQKCKAFLS